MSSSRPLSDRRRSRYSSPPPAPWSDAHNGPLCRPRALAVSVLNVLEGAYNDTSLLHRVLLSQSLVALTAVKLCRPHGADPVLSVVLLLLQIALVADRASSIALRLLRLSGTSKALDCVLYNTPLVSGSCTELALAGLVLRDGKAASADALLMGCAYAKPLAMGALLPLVHSFRSAKSAAGLWAVDHPPPFWLLGLGGALVLASAPHIESEHQWISHGVPLFLLLHLGFTYSLGSWRNAESERRTAESDRAPKQSDAICRNNNEWLVLLAFLLALRAVAVLLVHDLAKHLHGLAPSAGANKTLIDFIVLPVVIAALDHSTNVGLAFAGDVSEPWTNVIQSTLATYFFTRPLAALAGHEMDPARGRVGFGVCLVAIAVWLSIPVLPSFVKGSVLLLAYACASFLCATRPDLLQHYILSAPSRV